MCVCKTLNLGQSLSHWGKASATQCQSMLIEAGRAQSRGTIGWGICNRRLWLGCAECGLLCNLSLQQPRGGRVFWVAPQGSWSLRVIFVGRSWSTLDHSFVLLRYLVLLGLLVVLSWPWQCIIGRSLLSQQRVLQQAWAPCSCGEQIWENPLQHNCVWDLYMKVRVHIWLNTDWWTDHGQSMGVCGHE